MKRLFAIVCFGCGVLPVLACSAASTNAGSNDSDIEQAVTVPELGDRLDRLGRPEITNMLLTDPSKGILDFSALKEQYNIVDTFALADDFRADVGKTLATSIVRMDGYDKQRDVTDADAAKLAAVLVDDYLRVDLTKTCDLDAVAATAGIGFFTIERAELTGAKPSSTCGGRTPNEDVIDVLVTLYGKGVGVDPKDGIGDKVDGPTKKAPNTFPYLAEPLPPPAAPASSPSK